MVRLKNPRLGPDRPRSAFYPPDYLIEPRSSALLPHAFSEGLAEPLPLTQPMASPRSSTSPGLSFGPVTQVHERSFLVLIFAICIVWLLGIYSSAQAQSVSVAEWNFTSASTPLDASITNVAVQTAPVSLVANGGITLTRSATGTIFEAAGSTWPGTEDTGFIGTRTSLTPRSAKSLSTSFILTSLANGDWSNLSISFKYQRPTTAPTRARAVITWQQSGVFKRAYTSAITLAGTAWTTSTTKFAAGDALPTTLAGLPCLVELYFWGTSTTPNGIYLDDAKLVCNSLTNVYALYPTSLNSWPQNRSYSAQFSVPGYSGTPTWSSSGSLPLGLALNASTGELSGTPTALGSSTFTITATGAGGLNVSKSYVLNTVAPPVAMPVCNSVARLTFDGDTTANSFSAVPPADVASCYNEFSFGYDATGTMSGSIHAGGKNVGSGNPISATLGGQMRCFLGWDSAYGYSTTRNGLLHYNLATSSSQIRFGVYPGSNTASIPTASQTNSGEGSVWQTRIKLDPNASGDLRAFYFDALRWQKDLMDVPGINGPRWAELHAYWTNDAGVVQRWDSPVIDVQAVYLPEHRAVNQYNRYWVDLDSGTTGLNDMIRSTTSKYRSRTVFFDLYLWYDAGADLTTMASANPPVILIDEIGVAGNFTCVAPQMGVGNTVFNDTNYNGHFDPGEGVAGVKVELLNISNAVLKTTTTTTRGNYLFSGLVEGNYKVRIPASEFASGKPLYQLRSITGAGGDSGVDDGVDENGIDDADPATNGIYSSVIALSMDSEPTASEIGNNTAADAADDDNTDLTVDFGFVSSPLFCVGNRVFKDSNGNATYDPGEGADGVTVQLLNSSNSVLATQTTANGGLYLFSGLASSQSYYVRVAPSNFNAASVLDGFLSVSGNGSDNGVDHDDNGVDDTATTTNGIKSALITPDASQGGVFSYTWPPSAGASMNNQGGTWYQITARHDYVTDQVDVSVTLDTTTQNTQALWMVITNGVTPTSVDTNYAAFYLVNGTVTVTPYSANPTTSHTLGSVITTTPYTVTNIGTKRTFRFSLDVSAVNQWSSAPATWLGTGFPYDAQGGFPDAFNKKIGLWMRSFADGSAALAGSNWTVSWGGASDPNIGIFDDVMPLTEVGCDTTVDFGFKPPAPSDHGDWDGSGAATASTGSIMNSNLRLGASVDAETTVPSNVDATADGADEDGVTMPLTITQAASVSIPVSVLNSTGANAYLHSWIDFNNDGTFSDALITAGGERLEAARLVGSSGGAQSLNVTFTVPAGASVGTQRGVRFRLTNQSATAPIGASGTGEIEDYVVRICPVMSVCPAVAYLPTGTQGASYSMPISAVGGTPGYTFSLASGSLNPGLSLNGTTGAIAGTPSAVGTRTFTIQAMDSTGCVVTRTYTLDVVAAGSVIQVVGGSGTGNVPIQRAIYQVGAALNTQTTEAAGVLVQTDSPVNLTLLTVNDAGTPKTLTVANLNGGSVANVSLSSGEANVGVLLNGTPTSIASSGILAFATSAIQVATNTNLNHYIYDDRGEGEPDTTGEYDLRFNYALTTDDYIVVQERNGNSHVQLQPLDATGNVIAGSLTVQVRGTHDWNTGYASASYQSGQPFYLTAIRQSIFGTTSPIFGFRLSIYGADCKFFAMSENTFTDNPTSAGLIGDLVWNDSNRNGIQDAGEAGVSGVTVRLLDAGTSATVASTTTNASGIYSFVSIAPGNYRVEFVLPPGYFFAPQNQGSNDARDSDADLATGRTETFTMMPCDSLSHYDAGIYGVDFGDHPGFASASQTAVGEIRIGTNPTDVEAANPTATGANADDATGVDDEDLTMPVFTEGSTTTLAIPVTLNTTNLSGNTSRIGVFVDWNGDGDVLDANETLAAQTASTNGASVVNFSLTPPIGTVAGTKYLRVRLAEGTVAPLFGGASTLKGEVEDYAVTVNAATQCFSVAGGTTTLYRVNHLTGTVTTVTNAPYNVKSVAYDGATKTLYYNEYAWPNGRLGKYNTVTNTHTNIGNVDEPASGTWSYNPSQRPSSLTYISGKLYYVHPGTDDLVRIDMNVGETAITNQVKVADLTNNVRSLGWVGDITVSPDGLLWVAAHYELGHWNPATRVFTTIAAYPTYTDPSSAYFMALMHDSTTGLLYGQKSAAVSTSIFRINKTTGAEAIQAATTPVHDSWDYACAEPSIDLTPPLNDFGDWNGSGAGNPSWIADPALTLGAKVDAELNSIRNSSATGDDTTGVDDEDGVTWPTFQAGGSFKVAVDTHNSTPDYCSMQGWVDWNNNGTFEASEALWTEWGSFVWIDPIPTPWTLTSLPAVKVPVGAVTGVPLGARVRIIRSLEDPPNPVSSGTVFGEVEDYTVTVQPQGYDHGDFASFGDASSLTNAAFTIGRLVDAEATAATTANADGDDTSNNDDEDGVWAGVIAQGQTNAQILVELNNTSGVTGYLNVWVDFNRNGSLIDAGEQVATNIAIANNSTYHSEAVNFNVPVGASVGTAGVRVRFTTVASPGPVGASSASVSGEVEDVAVNIEPAVQSGGCYRFAFKDLNRDLDFLDLGETVPSQGYVKDYWAGIDTITNNWQLDPGESVKGWIDNLDMKYDRSSQQLTVDVTVGRNRGADISQLYFAVNSGAMPTLSNNLALVYIDGYNATNPVVTVYKYDPSLSSGTFLNRQLMVSTASGGPNASDVVSKSVTRSSSGTRFQLVLNCARINNAANWTAYGITSSTWSGVQFGNTAGMWIHANALTGPQTYDSSGNMTVANQGDWRDEEVFIDTNPSSAFLAEGCFDYGDYAGFAPAYATISSNLYLGAGPPDADPTDPSTISTLGDNAIGDDNTGSDDEDITPPVLAPGTAMNLVIPVFNNTGSNAFLSVWIDYNANHAVDAGEQVVVNEIVASQASTQSLSYPINVPASPALGAYLAVRYRLSSISGTGLAGTGGFGEVEDHLVTIDHPLGVLTFDFTSLTSFPGAVGQTFTTGGVTATVTSSENFTPAAWQNYSGGPSTTLYMRGGTGALPPSGNTRTLQVNFSQPILFQSGIVNLDLDNQSYSFELMGGAVWSAFKVVDALDREADYNVPVGVGSSIVTLDWNNGTGNSRGDDAWWTISGPVTGIKITQRVPSTLTFTGENVSFCFGSFTIAPGTDYGDASAFALASQYTSADVRIGTVPTDSDLGYPSTGTANADDTTGTDDEDLVMPGFTVGVATNLTIPVTLNTAALSGNAARVRVFVDWNSDGDVVDVNETLNGQTVSVNGTSSVVFSVTPPTGTIPGTKYLRVRVTEGMAGPTFSGASTLKGEVEDYLVTVGSGVVSDFGDWNGIGAATATTSSAFNSNLRIGATVDSEVSVTPNAAATADGADEDGVWFAPSVTVGSYAQLSVKATNLTGSAAYLNAWVDFNANGTFDTGEQVAANVTVPTGTTGYDPAGYNSGSSLYQYYRLQFPVPASASVGTGRGVRVRLTNVLNTPAIGASGTGEVEDYTMSFVAAEPCYHFRLADSNGDVAFNPATEITPSQSNSPIYWDQSGNIGSYKSLDATFNPSSKLFTFDCTVQQISATGVRADGIWFMINTGPLPLQTPVQRYAMVYIDAFNRTAPKAMVYVEDSVQHGGSWSSPARLMVSTAPGGVNAGDVKVLAVTEDTTAKTVRFRLILDCNQINDRTQWPTVWGLDADWRGLQFLGNCGIWCTATDMTAAPTYDASGKATAMNMAANSYLGIDVHPMGFTPLLTETCKFDFGDHFFSITSSASQLASADIKIGTNATDADGDISHDGATLDDATGTNDEELSMPCFTVGGATNLVIPVSIPVLSNLSGSTSRIGAWVDWNGDGDVLDTNEALPAQTVAVAGTSNVTFSLTPPTGTTLGTKYLRIRITEGNTAPTFAGLSGLKGEVEDYGIIVGETIGNLPGLQTLPIGTLIIPMDNTLQGGGTFNLKAYGLAVRLLHADVPLKWIINPSKGKDGVDFSANASRVKPTASGAAVRSFKGGPLAIHPGFEDEALAVINAFGNNVAVYVLNADATVNVDSTLMHKPKVAVFDQGGNGDIHVAVLQEAGLTLFTHYQILLNATQIGPGSCFTVAAEPHAGEVDGGAALLSFLLSGGNFIGQCAAVRDYTQQGLLSGYAEDGALGGSMTFGNFDDPMAQFEGGLDDEGGSVTSFKLTTNPGRRIAYSSNDGARYKAYAGRVSGAPTIGGWVHYLAGHRYNGGTNESINGRRMMMNAVLRSANRPDSCGLGLNADYGDWNGVGITSTSFALPNKLRLGATLDVEPSLTPNATATADDTNGTDDEDGVTMPSTIRRMAAITLPVSVFNNTGGERYLHAWIDFNNDSVFDDNLVENGGERLEPVGKIPSSAVAKTVNVKFTVPSNASLGTGRGVRVRLSDSKKTLATTNGGVGEIEDYVVQISDGLDYGDYANFGTASQEVSSTIRIGTALTDAEANTPGGNATWDDNDGTDDEDLTMPIFTVGLPNTLSVPVTLTPALLSGGTSSINVFVDWNGDGDVADANETLAAQTVAANGTTNVTFTLTPPLGTTAGIKYLRVRIAEGATHPGFSGASSLKGEVEDYVVQVCSGGAVLWAVDEDADAPGHLHLWSFDNYDTPTMSAKDHGRLSYRHPTTSVVIDIGESADDLEALAVNRYTGQAYFLISGNITGGPSGTQTLFTYNLNDVAANSGNIILTVLGHLTRPTSGVAVESLAFDPLQGRLYTGDPKDGDQNTSTTPDDLCFLDIRNLNANPMLATPWVVAGSMSGAGQTCNYSDGMEFASNGKLYTIDGTDEHLYEINPATGAIVSVSDTNVVGGLGGSPDIESLVWDDVTSRLIGIDNNTNATTGHRFVEITMGTAGSNVARGQFLPGTPGLPSDADFEGAAMWNACPSQPLLGVGNLVFKDLNDDGNYDAGEGAANVRVYLYAQGQTAGTSVPIAITTTDAGGKYGFTRLLPGSYFIHIPAANFATGQPLAGLISVNGVGSGDDNADEDGIDDASPSTNGISSAVFVLSDNGEPTNTIESGFASTDDDSDDNNTDLTIDFGFVQPVLTVLSIGDLVWGDTNNNGVKDTGESGLGGVVVTLFQPGTDGLVNTADDVQIGSSVTTSASGAYQFTALVDGNYFVKVSPPAGYPLTGGTPATADNNVNNNNDGAQPGGAGTALFSPVINLAAGAESTSDGDADSNSNLTVDFGLFSGFTVGNLVFNDVNNNGVLDAGEPGISGLTVELLNATTNAVLATTTTNATGQYGFLVYAAGSYKVRVAPNATYPLASSITGSDNGVDNRNDGSASGLAGAASTSFTFSLAAGGEPGTTGTTNVENTIDFGFRTCPTITISPTSSPLLTIGKSFNQNMSASGGSSPYRWSITSGALPLGLSLNTSSGNISGVPLATGVVPFTLTARDANDCQGQVVMNWTTLAPPSIDFGDYLRFGSAGSTMNTGLRIGALVDAEYAAVNNNSANGDDADGSDDEDGVSLPEGIAPLLESTINVIVTNVTASPAYLNVWVDYNQNGSLTDSGELVRTNIVVAAGTVNGVIPVVFTPPTTIATGFTGVRVRLTNTASPGPTGTTGTGEVEDNILRVCPAAGFAYGTGMGNLYQINVSTGEVIVATPVPAGFTAANGAAYAQSLGTDGVVIFATGTSSDQRLAVWDRTTGVINAAGDLTTFGVPAGTVIHSGDFYNGYYYFVSDDTDDLWRVSLAGSSGSYAITGATKISDMWNNTMGHGYGDFVITPQGILYAHAWRVADGAADFFTLDLNQASPQATLIGRPAFGHNGITLGIDGKLYGGLGVNNNNADWFQVSLATGQSTYLNAGFINGLTDMTMGACSSAPVVNPVTDQDFGDFGPFAAANSKVDTTTRLGGQVDADTSINANLAASGDDSTGVDDEDGVVMPATIALGTTLTVPVTVTNSSGSPAYLSAWIDLNGNYSLDDAGEQFITNVTVPTGTSNITQNYNLTVPLSAMLGSVGIRFRLSSVSAAAPSGAAGNGEVEDYAVTLVCPTISIAPASLPAAYVSTSYSAVLTASGGKAPYTWRLASGTLPAGITVNASTGVVSGTPPATASSNVVTFEATDARGCVVQTAAMVFNVLSFSIGNKVWHDANCNGLCDTGESGIGGTTLQLYTKGTDGIAYTADDVLVKSTTTAADGSYRFDNLLAGSYWVKLSPLVTTFPLATLSPVTLDNGIDNDNNGSQPGGGGTTVRSPVIVLAAGTEPTSEDGDPNSDMTIDFGMRPGFRIGDLVWKDTNDNGIHEASEGGLASVAVNLMSPGADGVIGGGDDTVVMTTSTNGAGNYLFTLPVTGNFFIRVTPPTGFDVPSLASSADNGVDEDNNGSQPGGPTTFVYSTIFNLTQCVEPGSTGSSNDELTIDVGLVPNSLGIGNLVFRDDDGDSLADAGEGINGVTVQLYRSSQTPGVSTPIAITTTAGGGYYQFINLARGQYIVHIPAVMFGTGGSMKGMLSIDGVQTGAGDDNLGEDGLDSATPETTGISSRLISVAKNTAPVDSSTETGMNYTDDNTLPGGDSDNDFTVDLGFYRWVGVGNLVFFDANGDGKASASEGVNGVRVELYYSTQTPGVDTPLEWATTANGGKYLFNKRPPGIYRLHIPKEMFASNGPLAGKMSIAQGLFGDDDVGEDGLNDTSPQDEGVSSAEMFLVAGVAPTAQNGETGVDNTSDDSTDAAINLTVDFGFQDPTAVGNLVYRDTNANGHFDSGEGVDDVLVQIYRSNTVAGSVPPVAQITTSNGGHYKFSGLAGGDYFIHLPISNFETNGPLEGLVSMSGTATTDTDDNVGEDGLDTVSPVNTGVSTAVFTLLAGSMPVNSSTETGYLAAEDDANLQDANGNMTIDLGLVEPDPNRVGLGNAVFNDLNGDGHFDDGEGVDGVTVQLYNTSNTLMATTTTGSGGCYLFSNLTPGTYYVKLPASNWTGNGALKGLLPIPGQGGDNGQDDDLDENGDDPASPSTTGVRSTNITLATNAEPTNYDTEVGKNTLIDEGLDDNYDLTVDFGFYDRCGVGNLVFVDANGNGKADNNEGVSGVTVKIFAAGADPRFDTPLATQVTETTRKGFFMFLDLNPGAYFLHIPAAMFQTGGPLLGKASLTGVEAASVDDSGGENGIDPGDISDEGISTDVFILRPGTMPSTTETGLFGNADNSSPNGISGYNIDLTRDFGFVSNACIGNLVFKDLDRDGKFTNGVDVGVDGVTVQLWSGTTLKDTKVTTNGGLFEFCTVPGSYSIKIPASMFQTGAPLANLQATTLGTFMASGSTTNWQDDNVGQDASDNGNPLANGASTGTFATAVSTMPGPQTGETGFASSSDDLTETDVNLTIDLGFKPLPLTAGNLVFNDVNSNGLKDANESGVAGVTVKLFADTVDPQAGTATATTVTGNDGSFMLQAYAEGQYFIHVPKAMFATGAPLAGKNSSPGAGTGVADDNVDENGLDSATPTTTGVSTGLFSLVYGTAPVDAGTERGVLASADNAADANGNLTLDLGFRVPPPGTPLAGRVRRDLNGDGTATTVDAPLAGVEVAVYVDENQNAILDATETNAVATTQSAVDGTYLFEGLAPDAYLVQALPLPGSLAVADSDGGAPDQTSVVLGAKPVTYIDFLQCPCPDTFAQWQSQHVLGDQSSAADDPDGDGLDNLAEYALGSDPKLGVRSSSAFRLEATAGIDALLRRPVQGHQDLRYVIEGSRDAHTWAKLSAVSTSTVDGNEEVLRYTAIAQDLIFQAQGRGFVRLRIERDADLDGVVEDVSLSAVQGFALRTFESTETTFSMPLVREAFYSGRTTATGERTLDVVAGAGLKAALGTGRECFVEIVSGAHAGQCFDLEEAATTDSQLVIDLASARNTTSTLPSGLADARVTVRAHWTLGDLLPATRFHGTTSASTADRVMFFENGGYVVHWLLATPQGVKWVRTADSKFADMGRARLVTALDGCFVQARGGAVTLPFVGEMRTAPLARRGVTSMQLLGTGSALAQTFDSLTAASVGDKLRLWTADRVAGASGFDGFTLGVAGWVRDADQVAVDAIVQLAPFRAFFLAPPAPAVGAAP